MKRFTIMILCILMLCSIVGCSSIKKSSEAESSENLSKVAAESSENLSKVAAESSENLSKVAAESSENLSKIAEEKIESKLLEKEMSINIYLPKGYTEKQEYPVLYFLYGAGATGEDETFSILGIDKEAERLINEEKIKPMIIASVQIDRSYGVNSSEKPDVVYVGSEGINVGMYEDYVTKEVVPFVDSNYSTVSSKEGRYIGGISMAGYASLHIAFRNTDMFSKVGGHSPSVEDMLVPFDILYPDEKSFNERAPLAIAKNKDLSELKIFLDCGDIDQYCQKGTKDLNDALVESGMKPEYFIGSGEHNNDYWKSNLERYLTFYDAV